MCKFRYEDRTSAGELRARGSFYRTEDCNGFGRLERMEERAQSIKCRTFKVSGSLTRGQPRKTWNEVIRSDLKESKVSKDTARDKNGWKSFMRNKPMHAWKADVKQI